MKTNMVKLLSIIPFLFHLSIDADTQSCPEGWIKEVDVHVLNEGIAIETNSGMLPLEVVRYDPVKEAFLVKCIFIQDVPYPSPQMAND